MYDPLYVFIKVRSFLHGCWALQGLFAPLSSPPVVEGWLRYKEQVQYLCLVSHSSSNSRPSIYHMDMVCQCLWPHTLRGFSLLPFRPSAAVPAFWPSPVPWEASPTFQLKMRRSTMTVTTKEVSDFLSVCLLSPAAAEGRSGRPSLSCFWISFSLWLNRISLGRQINDRKQSLRSDPLLTGKS